MCKIKSIHIKGFRGIRELRLEGLGRINILLGNNNSGKSSTLEALMVLMGASKPTLPMEMNINRNYNGVKKEDLLLFFYEMDGQSSIELSSEFEDGGVRNLRISYFENLVKRTPISDMGNGEMPMRGMNYGLRYEYVDNGQTKNSSAFVVRTDKKEISAESTEKGSIRRNAVFIAPRYNFNDFINHFNQIVTDKEKGLVLDVLRNVEKRIKDVVVIGNNVMVDIGLPKLVPINVLGDGTRKMFTLITAMYSVRGGTLVIDEVDNGLYYKSMRTLWSALLTVARQLDVQLFASTHSIDSLNALSDVLEKDCVDNRQDVEIYTLRRKDDDDITPFPYNFEKFNYLLGQEVEIR